MRGVLGMIDSEVKAIGGEEVTNYNRVAEVEHANHQKGKEGVHQVVEIENSDP